MLSVIAMVTKTTISAIRALSYLSRCGLDESVSPRRMAEALGESPTYLAKVARLLVRNGILRAERGVKGGVRLGRAPNQITLLAVVEACQGAIVGDYCRQDCDVATVCPYHRAALELQEAVVAVLSRWDLERITETPQSFSPPSGRSCLIALGPELQRSGARP